MSTLKVNTITPLSGDTVTVSGSLTTTGKLTIGDATNDTVVFSAEVSSSIIPDANNTYDLGSPTKVWREIYVSSESLNFVDGAGNSTKFTKENVDKIKSGKSLATVEGFENAQKLKAVFQDGDSSTYKKMTIPGRVSQFMSGALIKDYNKSGDNSYSKKDGIETYEWNNALSMSFNTTNSFWNIENMSMDITEGGFYGLAVSGSTLASNLHNMANNTSGLFLTGSDVIISGSTSLSGSTTFEGGDTTISQSTSDTLNVSGGNVVISSSFTQSGEAVFEGGTTTINGTAQTQSLIVSGGQIQFEVEDSGSSFEISGSEGTTLNVSGGITTFVVSNTESLVQITGSEGTTLNVSGGNVVISSSFTQSGTSTFDNGTSTFSGNTSTTESILSGSGIAAEVSGTLTADNVVLNQSNMVPVTSSQTLTYTGPKPYYVRSGSGATFPSGPQQGLPIGSATYTAYTPGQNPGPAAGELTLTLPTAQVGMQFTIKNLHDYVLRDITAGQSTAVNLPSLKIKPQATDGFYAGATGNFSIANGKGIINHSASAQTGDEAMIWSPSGSKWMIGSLVGTWIDEA